MLWRWLRSAPCQPPPGLPFPGSPEAHKRIICTASIHGCSAAVRRKIIGRPHAGPEVGSRCVINSGQRPARVTAQWSAGGGLVPGSRPAHSRRFCCWSLGHMTEFSLAGPGAGRVARMPGQGNTRPVGGGTDVGDGCEQRVLPEVVGLSPDNFVEQVGLGPAMQGCRDQHGLLELLVLPAAEGGFRQEPVPDLFQGQRTGAAGPRARCRRHDRGVGDAGARDAGAMSRASSAQPRRMARPGSLGWQDDHVPRQWQLLAMGGWMIRAAPGWPDRVDAISRAAQSLSGAAS